VTDDEAAGVAVESERVRSAMLFIGQEVAKIPPASVLKAPMPQVDRAVVGMGASWGLLCRHTVHRPRRDPSE